jgi:hypothetical protein
MRSLLDTMWIWPFLVGVVPVLLARTGRARRVAILFGLLSMALGVLYMSGNGKGSGTQHGLRRIGLPIIGALLVALISVILTYALDRKHRTKP